MNRLVGQIALNVLGQFGRRGVPLFSRLGECFQTDRLQRWIDRGIDLARGPRRFLAYLMQYLHRFLARKRRSPGQDFVENGP